MFLLDVRNNVCVYRGKDCLTGEKIPLWKKKMDLNLQLSYPWFWEYYLYSVVCFGFVQAKFSYMSHLLWLSGKGQIITVSNIFLFKLIFPVSGCWFCSLKDLLFFFLLRKSQPKHRDTQRVGNNHDNESCSLQEAKQVAWLKPMSEWQKFWPWFELIKPTASVSPALREIVVIAHHGHCEN